MKKVFVTLALATFALGSMTLTSSAGPNICSQSVRTNLNMTPIVQPVACNGHTGRCGCARGWVSACANRCCHCVPC